jgi:hypothetical protein
MAAAVGAGRWRWWQRTCSGGSGQVVVVTAGYQTQWLSLTSSLRGLTPQSRVEGDHA